MKWRGFTLIELIVVISMVAVLAALLVPVLRGARERARSTICQTHLRELLLAFERYYNAENGLLPCGFDFGRQPAPPGGYAGNPLIDPAWSWWWFDYLEVIDHGSLRDSEIIKCPSKHLDDTRLARDILCGNYGVNEGVCRTGNGLSPYDKAFAGSPLSVSDIRHPGSTLLIVDSGYALICWWQAADEPPAPLGNMLVDTAYIPGLEINKDRSLWPGQIEDAISGRHPGKTVNIGFADGHVGRKKADKLLVKKIDDDAYANLSPLWDPK